MGVQKARPRNGGGDDSNHDDAMSDISTSSVTSSSTIAHNEMNLMDLYLSGPPGTPSAYSTASAQSNLSMRSTTSTRSFVDGRPHRGNSGGNTTPGTARFFKNGNGSGRSGYSIFGSSGRATTTIASSTTPAGRGHSGTLFNETNTPRSYIGGLTPDRLPIGPGFGIPTSAASTPRGAALSAGDANEADASEHERRKSVFKQNPLDLTYLRDSVRVKIPGDDMSTNDTDMAQALEEVAATKEAAPATDVTTTQMIEPTTTDDAVVEPKSEVTTEVTTPPALEATAPLEQVESSTTDALPAPGVSTTPRRLRGESSAAQLPPAKIARHDDDDVEMEDATMPSNDHNESATTECETTESTDDIVEPAEVTKACDASHTDDETIDFEMDEPLIHSNANSTSTTESSIAVQLISTPSETPRKSFLGGLFSRASLESKSASA